MAMPSLPKSLHVLAVGTPCHVGSMRVHANSTNRTADSLTPIPILLVSPWIGGAIYVNETLELDKAALGACSAADGSTSIVSCRNWLSGDTCTRCCRPAACAHNLDRCTLRACG